MKMQSPVASALRFAVIFCGIAGGLPLFAQVSHTYTGAPPPGYPATGVPRQPVSTRASRQATAAVQAPVTQYPATYPPPSGYTYPPPQGYRYQQPRTAPLKKTTTPKSAPKVVAKPKPKVVAKPTPKPVTVYKPSPEVSSQVARIRENDKIQNARIGELERDVGGIKRNGSGTTLASHYYNGGTDITPHTTYVARPGDTLFRIASTHRVSVGEIQQLNRMTADEVRVGQTLLIPSPHRMGPPITPVSYEQVSTAPTYRPQTPTYTTRTVSSPMTYTVRKGDSLKAIAIKHKMSTANLAAANGIKDMNKIVVGQRLKIPGRTVQTQVRSHVQADPDLTPLPDFSMPAPAQPMPPAAGMGMAQQPMAAPLQDPAYAAPAPAPALPSAKAPTSNAAATATASMNDSHRGILAYRVDRADTMESIAHQFSTTPERIREINRMNVSTALKPGDEIMVPAMGAVSLR